MKILAIEREEEGVTKKDFEPHMKAEAAQAYELYQAGIIREIYFRQDEPIAVLILECTSMGEAKEALDSLPLVKAGLITFDLMPLKPYPGFARLFFP